MITDGDIRRNLDKDLPKAAVTSIMTKAPKAISPDMLGRRRNARYDRRAAKGDASVCGGRRSARRYFAHA